MHTAAGVHHLSFAATDDVRQQTFNRRVLWEEKRTEGDASALMKVYQIEYYGLKEEKHINLPEEMPMPDTSISLSDIKSSDKWFRIRLTAFVSLTTPTIGTPPYPDKLIEICSDLGGNIHHAKVLSMRDTLRFVDRMQQLMALVIDEEIDPIRGQVVVLNALWVAKGCTKQVKDRKRTYIIP
ncbi:hypothetical protein GGU11DRAFT_757033 [Lentinula aff. detonsa]|nr:hypothetical protein GGU11DRAFT_757033 [Lentinula aff. detonsa]